MAEEPGQALSLAELTAIAEASRVGRQYLQSFNARYPPWTFREELVDAEQEPPCLVRVVETAAGDLHADHTVVGLAENEGFWSDVYCDSDLQGERSSLKHARVGPSFQITVLPAVRVHE